LSTFINEQSKPFLIPHENTLINYGYTEKQMFLTDKQKISRLGSDLNKHFDKLINNEVEKSKERG